MEKLKIIYKKCVNRETVLYLIFGILATIVSFLTYVGAAYIIAHDRPLTELEVNIANLISWVLTVSFAFVTNKIWVFESHTTSFKELFREIAAFFGARVFSLGFEIVWMTGFCFLLGTQYDKYYKIGAQFGIVAMNYIFSKLFIFKKK